MEEGPRGYKQLVREELARRKILRVGLGRIPPAARGLNCQEQILELLREERDVLKDLIYVHRKRDWDVVGMKKIISALEAVVAEIELMIAPIVDNKMCETSEAFITRETAKADEKAAKKAAA